jgi:hypothetical protein
MHRRRCKQRLIILRLQHNPVFESNSGLELSREAGPSGYLQSHPCPLQIRLAFNGMAENSYLEISACHQFLHIVLKQMISSQLKAMVIVNEIARTNAWIAWFL